MNKFFKNNEKKLLYFERNKFFDSKKFKKISKREKINLLNFCDEIYLNKEMNKNWRFINFILKCQKILRKNYYSHKDLKKIYND